MTTRATTARRPSHASKSLTPRLTRFTRRFPRLLRTEYWTRSRAGGLWTSLFGAHRRKLGCSPPTRRNRRIFHRSSDLRMESLEPRRLLTVYTPTTTSDLAIPSLANVNSANGQIQGTGTGADGQVTLRSAVIAANADPNPDADTIVLAASATYTLSIAGNDADSLVGDLDINDSLTITGNNAIIQGATAFNSVTRTYTNSIGDKIIGINQDGSHRGLTVTVNNVTIKWGDNTIANGDPSFAYTGGGVDVFLTGTGNNINFNNCTITECTNEHSYGGGVNVDSGQDPVNGGDTPPNTLNRGTVTFTGCTVSSNEANGSGGGMNLYGDIHDVNITNCIIQNNIATGGGGDGGGIDIRHTYGGTDTIMGSTITGNSAVAYGGGILFVGGAPGGGQNTNIIDTSVTNNTVHNNGASPGYGGGIWHDGDATKTTTLTHVTISGNKNTAGNTGLLPYGGGLAVGSGNVVVNGNANGDSSITNNISDGDGGGVAIPNANAVFSMTGGSITGNTATNNGGGIFVDNGGSATLSKLTITGNTANSDSANTGTVPPVVGGDGGAAYVSNNGASIGTLSVNFSRITGNIANAGGGGTTGTTGIRNITATTVDATSDWWGAEANPGAVGTDKNVGLVNASPRLHLGLAFSPTTVEVNHNSTLTADFTKDSSNNPVTLANLVTLIGLPISFSSTGGTTSGAQATIQANGMATATYNAGGATGSFSASAQVDNLPAATTNITVFANADLAITSNSDSPDPVGPGNNITYTISFINNGPDSGFSVNVKNTVPANTTFVSATTPSGWMETDSVPVGGTGDIVFAKSSVASAETASFTVVVKVNLPPPVVTTITDTATVSTTDPNTNDSGGNNSQTATTTVATLDFGDAPAGSDQTIRRCWRATAHGTRFCR